MSLISATRAPALTTGLSVALLAVLTGMAQAQDAVLSDPPAPADEFVLYPYDPVEPIEGDPIEVLDGTPINTDGIGDGEPLPLNTDGIGDGEPLPDVTTQEFPDSNCGGCELENLAGGPDVQRTATGLSSGGNDQSNNGPDAAVVSNDNNICYNADLYIPLLCDWQRPFVGDLMP